MKTPSTNIQAPEKFQAPNIKDAPCSNLDIEAWRFSGACELGIFLARFFMSIRG
jgi:hypothetical protein